MSRPIKIRINVTKILKDYIFEGKNGKYLNLVAWPNKNGTGQYGDTHFVAQDIPKEAREGGVQAPILGNLTLPEDEQPVTRSGARKYPGDGRSEAPRSRPAAQSESFEDGIEDEPIPF